MANIRIIEANDTPARQLRVAAYCRVSSGSFAQYESFTNQVSYYTDFITKHDDWQLVDIYADEGISGTSLNNRDDLMRMLHDCKKGRIDKILTKSMSRLARNTRDILAILRELKAYGVTVQFEKENIDTGSITSELMISIFDSLAQEESNSISQNLKKSYKWRMESGQFITCNAPFGYRLVNGRELAIDETEAEIVRMVFESYLAGINTCLIADELTRMGVPTSEGRTKWNKNGVLYMLTNEKYIGDTLCQKSFVENCITHKKIYNRGEKNQYYVTASHPAIIDRETFERAQALRLKRYERAVYEKATYPLTKKIFCGNCGTVFMRRVSKSGFTCWVCRNHDKDRENCKVGRIPEIAIYDAFVRMYNKLKSHSDILFITARDQLKELTDSLQRENPKIMTINKALAEATDQLEVLSRLREQEVIDVDIYRKKSNTINAKITELRRSRRMIQQNDDIQDAIEDIDALISILDNGPDSLTDFNETLFSDITEKMIMESNERIRFRLIGGVELTERIVL